MLQRICVPLDGSLVAETVVSLAVRLARATQATIELMRVLPP